LKAGYSLQRTEVTVGKKKQRKCVSAVGKSTSATQFSLNAPAGRSFPRTGPEIVTTQSQPGGGDAQPTQQAPTATLDACGNKVGSDPSVPVTFVLRSPDSMIYYLGEIVRATVFDEEGSATKRKIQIRLTNGRKVDLFRVERGTSLSSAIAVDFQGSTYTIPPIYPRDDHRSTQVITLINQLIALQKEASSAPSLPPVTVIAN
jgi:hypothetical protein